MAEVRGELHNIGAPGLRHIDVQAGEGTPLTRGQCAYVHYDLYRTNGAFIESSRDSVKGKPAEPLAFPLGAGKVIRGWDLGLEGMKIGGIRRLYVPEDLAYGAAGSPPLIPRSVGLIFDVQLLYTTESRNSLCLPWRALQP
jgi:peptidylprolyl isomerase